MSRTRRTRAVLVAVAASTALAACGSGTSAARGRPSDRGAAVGTAGAGTAARTHALAYARCMRDHGVEFPDPTFDADGRARFEWVAGAGESGTAGADGPVDTAQEACASTWPAMEGRAPRSPGELARLRTALLAYASCMRDHGVDFPDPTFDRDGRPRLEHDTGAAARASGHDATFTTAVRACRDQIGDRPVMGAAGSR